MKIFDYRDKLPFFPAHQSAIFLEQSIHTSLKKKNNLKKINQKAHILEIFRNLKELTETGLNPQ